MPANGSSVRFYVLNSATPPAHQTTGKKYALTGSYIDIARPEADGISPGGSQKLIEIGTTAQRPTPTAGVSPSEIPLHYYDTTLSEIIFWIPSKKIWVDINGSTV